MSHNLKGKVKEVGETQEFSSGFTKREFVITTDDKYPQDVKFEVVKDNCEYAMSLIAKDCREDMVNV